MGTKCRIHTVNGIIKQTRQIISLIVYLYENVRRPDYRKKATNTRHDKVQFSILAECRKFENISSKIKQRQASTLKKSNKKPKNVTKLNSLFILPTQTSKPVNSIELQLYKRIYY